MRDLSNHEKTEAANQKKNLDRLQSDNETLRKDKEKLSEDVNNLNEQLLELQEHVSTPIYVFSLLSESIAEFCIYHR